MKDKIMEALIYLAESLDDDGFHWYDIVVPIISSFIATLVFASCTA